ncbi:MAG: GxxExxY protein [Gemmatimonadaceae bacterium]
MLLHREVSDRVLRAFFDVYNEVGCGFLEKIYRRCLAIAMAEQGLRAEPEVALPVHFRGRVIGVFRADFLVDRCLIVECKAVTALDGVHGAQVLNYLRASPIETALLLNFGKRPQFRRFILMNHRKKSLDSGQPLSL